MRASLGVSGVSVAPSDLAVSIEEYLSEHVSAVVIEDGRVLFDMSLARYSVGESHGRCLLQFWSEERNMVRTVVSAQRRATCLRLMTRRMGVSQPVALELVPNHDRRSPIARDTGRREYLRLFERVLGRAFPDWKTDGLRTAADLEHSFGPAYVRGRLLRGTEAQAVIGVGGEESSAMIDGVLTLGLLWLDHCREHSLRGRSGKSRSGASRHFGGLKVVVPLGEERVTAERMAWLNHDLAHFQLFTLDARSEELIEVDFRDSGNVESRLVHSFDASAALERAGGGVARLMELIPEDARDRVELRARSAAEVGLLLHGLEFARVRSGASNRSFSQHE